MGDTPVGLYTTGNYTTAADRPANKAFLAEWNKEYGNKAIPDFLSVDGWDGMHAVFDLIKSTKGKFTGEQAAAFFEHGRPTTARADRFRSIRIPATSSRIFTSAMPK